MILVIILQNFIKAYHRKSDKSKYDLKLTELDVETTRIRSRVNGVINTLYTTWNAQVAANLLQACYLVVKQISV